MQLDPTQNFAPQLNPLTGRDFENIVASCYYYLGYFVNRNLIVRVNRQNAAEIDVLASLITPLNEIRIAVECKGVTPSFNDLRKFSTVRTIIDNKDVNLSLAAYGANAIRPEHLKFAKLLGINLLKKEDLSKKVLPILWGEGHLVQERIFWINRYLSIFSIQDYLLNDVFGTITDPAIRLEFSNYRRYLYSDLWSIQNPVDQINDAFGNAQTRYNGFTHRIAVALGTTASAQLSNPTNPIVQLAMFLELEHRMFNLIGIARCSIIARTEQGRQTITERTPAIRSALNSLCDYNMSITKFCSFVFRWIYLWGGVIIKSNGLEDVELQQLADECGISKLSAKKFLEVIKEVYSHGNDLFFENDEKCFFKFVPAPFRSLGKLHRLSISPSQYNGINLFREDNLNRAMADRCLGQDGGLDGLRFS